MKSNGTASLGRRERLARAPGDGGRVGGGHAPDAGADRRSSVLRDDDLDEFDGASRADHVEGHLALVESEHAEVVGADAGHQLVVGGALREPALELVHDEPVDRADVQLVGFHAPAEARVGWKRRSPERTK